MTPVPLAILAFVCIAGAGLIGLGLRPGEAQPGQRGFSTFDLRHIEPKRTHEIRERRFEPRRMSCQRPGACEHGGSR